MKKIKTAMILAAGFGTRLKPLTDSIPKALVEFKGKPMVENVIGKLESFGIVNIIINSHHHYDKMNEYFANRKPASKIELVYEPEILGTGGAIKNIRDILNDNEDILIYNTDVDSEIDLDRFEKFHFDNNSPVTLAVQDRVTSRYLLTNTDGFLIGRTENNINIIHNKNLDSKSVYNLKAFCGIHIMKSMIFDYMPIDKNFDIISFYISLIKQNINIFTYDISGVYWKDIGIPQNL